MQNKQPPPANAADLSLAGSNRRPGLRQTLGYRTAEWREGYAVVELAMRPELLNGHGTVHGGLHAVLLDVAMGHAARWCTVPGNERHVVTLSLTTSYLEGGKGGLLRAIGHLEGESNGVAACTGEVVDESGRVLAVGQASFRFLTGSERPEGVPGRPRR